MFANLRQEYLDTKAKRVTFLIQAVTEWKGPRPRLPGNPVGGTLAH